MNAIELAKEAGIIFGYPAYHDRIERFAALVREEKTKELMQLFLDPENQPTQFGTAALEYRKEELAKARAEALEEAAKWFEGKVGQADLRDVAAAIRGLK